MFCINDDSSKYFTTSRNSTYKVCKNKFKKIAASYHISRKDYFISCIVAVIVVCVEFSKEMKSGKFLA